MSEGMPPTAAPATAPKRVDRAPRLRRVLRVGRAAAAPRAARQAGDRRRLRAARGRHDRVLRGAQSSASARRCRPRRRAGCARTRSCIPPDFEAYRETSREVWELVRERLERVQQIGLDEAYADLTGVAEAAARAARAGRRRRRSGPASSSRSASAPNRLVAKVLQRPRQARGLRRDGPRGGVRALRAATRRSRLPGIGPKTAERLRELGYRDDRRSSRRRREEQLAERFGDAHGRATCTARATFHDDSPVEPIRGREVALDRDDVRRRHRRRSPSSSEVLRRLARRALRGPAARGARGRTIGDQGPPRRLDRRSRARARSTRRTDATPTSSPTSRCELLRAYAPPRPVRLLGVRMASLADRGRRCRPRRGRSTSSRCPCERTARLMKRQARP